MRCSPAAGAGQREQVGVGEVLDVHVVADARAVGRRVVLAEDGQRLPLPRGDLQGQRDEVGLGRVPLAEPEGGARDVEVAQADRGEPVGDRVRGEHVVDGELGRAVGVGRPGRGVLPDRHRLRFAVGGRGRGEDDPPAVRGAHRLQQRQRAAHVGVPVVLRLLLRDADEALGREVQHRLGPDVGEHRRRVVQRDLARASRPRGRRRRARWRGRRARSPRGRRPAGRP